jgi:hypothetical protein
MNRLLVIAVALGLVAACGGQTSPEPEPEPISDAGFDVDTTPPPDVDNPEAQLTVQRVFPDGDPVAQTAACSWASPQFHDTDGAGEVIITSGERVAAFDADTGARVWDFVLPADEGEMAYVTGTPLYHGGLLVVAYHTTARTQEPRDVGTRRLQQLVAVVDLDTHALAEGFETPLVLTASLPASVGDGTVTFRPSNALARSDVTRGFEPDDTLGRAYIAFGNARDIQPWHGWAFEVDLDAWRAGGVQDAQSAVFLVTPEADCGPAGQSGSRERICGGGLWAPSGQLIVQREDGYDVILAAGNGQLDLARRDYANTLMKSGPGLAFTDGCDPEACANFNPDEPSRACADSCENLFIPRMPREEPYPVPEDGVCDGLTMYECWQKKDYVGGSTPAYAEVGDKKVLLYPTKDGALYMMDADHLGTYYDRVQLAAICGTKDDRCALDWAGMIVSKPAVTRIGDDVIAITPTFVPDKTHPAGVVAVKLVLEDGEPRFAPYWQVPRFDTAEAISRFRRHPSRITIATYDGVAVAWLVEVNKGGKGRLMGIRVWDGTLLIDEEMHGGGTRFTVPLVVGEKIFLSSCPSDFGPSWLEAYHVTIE